jgi:hypothetical protein
MLFSVKQKRQGLGVRQTIIKVFRRDDDVTEWGQTNCRHKKRNFNNPQVEVQITSLVITQSNTLHSPYK